MKRKSEVINYTSLRLLLSMMLLLIQMVVRLMPEMLQNIQREQVQHFLPMLQSRVIHLTVGMKTAVVREVR